MTKEIQRAGIPVVHVTNLTKISEGIGANRILRGNSVLHVFGNPSLPHEKEVDYRREMVAFAVVLSLSAAPAAMVLGPLAAAAGWVAVELFCRITGERRK